MLLHSDRRRQELGVRQAAGHHNASTRTQYGTYDSCDKPREQVSVCFGDETDYCTVTPYG
jgi:hypothetical protein